MWNLAIYSDSEDVNCVMTSSGREAWGVLLTQRLLLKLEFAVYSLMKLSWLPMGQDSMRKVLRDAPCKKRYLKREIICGDDKSQYQGSTWEIQQTRFQFPLYKQMQQKIFQQLSWVFLSVNSIIVVIALLFSNALVFSNSHLPWVFFSLIMAYFFQCWTSVLWSRSGWNVLGCKQIVLFQSLYNYR